MTATLLAYLCLVGTDINACTHVQAWPAGQWSGAKAERTCEDERKLAVIEVATKAPGKPIWFECELSTRQVSTL
jgi:hypothetical protein